MSTPAGAPPPVPRRYPPSSYASPAAAAGLHYPLTPAPREAPLIELEKPGRRAAARSRPTRASSAAEPSPNSSGPRTARPGREIHLRVRLPVWSKPDPLAAAFVLAVALAVVGWSLRPDTANVNPGPAPSAEGQSTAPSGPGPLIHGRPPSSAGDPLTAFLATGFFARRDALVNDLQRIGTAGVMADSATMTGACQSLLADTEAAQNYGPIPDGPAQDHWAGGLAQLALGATHCFSGARDGDTALMNMANVEMRTGGDDMKLARKRLHDLGH